MKLPLIRKLPDGREVHLNPMLFGNLRLCLSEDLYYPQEYCYHVPALAVAAFEKWDGESEPEGWAKNPHNGLLGDCPCEKCVHERAQPWNQKKLWRAP